MDQESQLLRFTTAGSVDDGKSTLIGRLLFDSKSILQDQLQAVEKASTIKGSHNLDLAMFTDGLREERELGITIDVAYRYFFTRKRKFIIADAPGHFEYTRNLVTAASTSNVMVLLIDATKGVVEQTKRHCFIASLLQIPHVIVCVNKMDLIGFSEDVFAKIKAEFENFSSKLLIKDIRFIPISALIGDNIVERSEKMNWYQGAPLLSTLESITISSDINKVDARFPVQTLIDSNDSDEQLIAGRLSSGVLRVGDKVVTLPHGYSSVIKSIHKYNSEIDEAFAPMSISLRLSNSPEISRGDMIVRSNNQAQVCSDFEVMLCWLNKRPVKVNSSYLFRHTSNEQAGVISDIVYTIDIHTLDRITDKNFMGMNDIGRVKVQLKQPLIIDSYRTNKSTGSLILIDCETNETVAAGMII